MSYDLMVFERTKAPKTRKEFLAWFQEQVDCGEEPNLENVNALSPALRSWFLEIKETFPPMNGVFAPDDEQIFSDEALEAHLTEYAITRDIAYVSFAWSLAEEAYALVCGLAEKHGTGFFDVSAENGAILLPDGTKIE